MHSIMSKAGRFEIQIFPTNRSGHSLTELLLHAVVLGATLKNHQTRHRRIAPRRLVPP